MKEIRNIIQPQDRELPSHYSDRMGVIYSALVSKEHKKKYGQFFTPTDIAYFMASHSKLQGNSIRILDPGCGMSVLSCALIEHLVKTDKNLKCIELVVYETDSALLPFLEKTLGYLKKWTEKKGINFYSFIRTEDFILENANLLNETDDLFGSQEEKFDVVISNPPYFKLSIDDKRARAAKNIVNGHPNIYAIFMAVSSKMINLNGELIFITPRSYASGVYFKTFREYFFNQIDLENVHLFISRKDTFSRDSVLQETIIIKCIKKRNGAPNAHTKQSDLDVIVTSSEGREDLKNSTIKAYPQKTLINLESNEKILYLPANDYEEAVLYAFRNWDGNLSKYNIKISTGRVVAFRSTDYIRENTENRSERLAPLIWLHNVKQMSLEWPIEKDRKGQFIIVEDSSKSILIPNKNYLFLRRFSSKDDKSRLIAAPYINNRFTADYIGVENKVNYIYRSDGDLEINEVVGLCALLNSTLFDIYFRIFNGNVNVSATELRDMPLPPHEIIKEIGDNIILSNDFSVKNANRIVKDYFEPICV